MSYFVRLRNTKCIALIPADGCQDVCEFIIAIKKRFSAEKGVGTLLQPDGLEIDPTTRMEDIMIDEDKPLIIIFGSTFIKYRSLQI